MQNRQCLRAFCNKSQLQPNGEKEPFKTTDQKVEGSTPSGCTNKIKGFRLGEARNITWADCDFVREEIVVRGDPEEGTKNSEMRRLPMIDEMRQLLQRLRKERRKESATACVMRVGECQKAMDKAGKKVGIHRLTYHDLRHLLATRCIESGAETDTDMVRF